MTTPYMNLILPTPSVTLGPTFAQMLNDAFEDIDTHDHSSGKGVKVKPNGLDINDDLDMQENALINAQSTQLVDQLSTLSGPSNAGKLHSYSGDLYFTNSSGTAVQITSGGSIITVEGYAQLFQIQSVNTNLTIAASDTFVYLVVNTSSSRTITLPIASTVSEGRIYIIKDSTGQANVNPITIATQGGDLLDGASSFTHDFQYGTFFIVCDGVSKYYLS